jgi:CubicO group peptidase (beta-lactamase class C family)
MIQITAQHLRPEVLRRPPRRPARPFDRRAARRVRPCAWLRVLLSLLALGSGASASAGTTDAPATARTTGVNASGETVDASRQAPSVAELHAFLDRRVPELLEAHGVPAASVAAVLPDGRIAVGYGTADLEAGAPATARTPFAMGSITKLLTWTTVMQQVERGRLSLDDEVDRFLDFEIPAASGGPLRVRHLMTHTTGFEDRPLVGLLRRDASALPELGALLARQVPERVHPPGRYAAYSNYGTALAGYLVERVDGRGWTELVEADVLAPLGLRDGAVRQPLPPARADVAARGYRRAGGQLEEVGPAWSALPPAGSWWGSAEDAARFLQAFLGDGSLPGGGRVLEPGTVRRMRSALHRHDPRLPGNAHGWWEEDLFGTRLLTHGGTQPGFETILALSPAHGVGLFVATNASGGTAVWRALLREVVGTFLAGEVEVAAAPAVDLERYAGAYQGTRYGTTTIARLEALANRLTVAHDGEALVLRGDRFVPQGDHLFVNPATGERLAFEVQDGRATALFPGPNPRQAYLRMPWHARGGVQAAVLLAAVATLLVGALGVPAAARLRRRGPVTPGRRWAVAAAAGFAAFGVGFAGLMADPTHLVYGAGPALLAVLTAGLAAAAASVLATIQAVRAWRGRLGTTAGRVGLTAVGLAGLTLSGLLASWNLLGYRL